MLFHNTSDPSPTVQAFSSYFSSSGYSFPAWEQPSHPTLPPRGRRIFAFAWRGAMPTSTRRRRTTMLSSLLVPVAPLVLPQADVTEYGAQHPERGGEQWRDSSADRRGGAGAGLGG